MSLPSEFDNEINALRREYDRQKPSDPIQFAANFFSRRLEAQRAEHLLASAHSSQQKGAPAMAQSTFPGTNPFVSSGGGQGMKSIGEEDEHDQPPGSPKAGGDPSSSMGPAQTTTSGQESSFGSFGSFNFAGNSGNRMPPMDGSGSLPTNYNFNRRTSVSAESMNPNDTESENWTPPSHPKTADQEARLRKSVAHNFIFSHLDEEQTTQVLGALVEKEIPKGLRVISQGDVGDYFYVVEKGHFDIFVSKTGKVEPGADGSGTKVNDIGPGGSFGELALMYNAPRAATVTSTEPSTVWQLDRVTFRRILMDSAFNRRRMYETFLGEIPLLAPLTDYERSRIADALNKETHPAGYTIIKEGDVGENFYMLESGTADVYKRGQDKPVHTYEKGGYFGELALLNNEPRAASVVSSSDVKLATLGKDGFHRLLGPAVIEEMRKNDPRHKSS